MPSRAFTRRAGDRHQPAHALCDLIEARALVIGAILAEAGDAAIDEARIDLAQGIVIDAEPRLDIGAEVFDHDVGLRGQPPEHVEPFWILQIERHRALVAVQVLKVGAVARAARLLAAGVFDQGVDLDDVGAPIRELPHAGRPGADPGEIENGEAGQGRRCPRKSHQDTPSVRCGCVTMMTDR